MEVHRLVAQALAHSEVSNEITFPPGFYPIVAQYDQMVARGKGTVEELETRRQRAFGDLANWMSRIENATG